MKKRWTIKNLQQWAADHEGKCQSKEYIGIDVNHTWRCKRGHVFDMRPIYVRQGAWCVPCTLKNQKSNAIELMHEWAAEIGWKCLSKEYVDSMAPLKWQCENGHIVNRPRKLFNRNKTCPQCNLTEEKNTALKRLKKIAARRGGKCLAKTYYNSATKIEWQCEYGHKWKAAPQDITVANNWCPDCGGTKRLSLELMQKLAKEKGGKCLSKEYKNLRIPLKWQCSKGHVWTTPSLNIRAGTWCRKCHMMKMVKSKDAHGQWTRISHE